MSSRRNSRRSRRRREKGIALLIVLWVLALLSFMLVGFAGDARTELLLARNQYQTAHARAIADAGVMMAVIGALDNSPQTQWPADSTPRVVSYDGGTIRISVQDEGGKVDLNIATPELILNLLRNLGFGNGDAQRLAEAIIEWRQAHQPPPLKPNGQVLQLLSAPPGAFVAPEQLRLVPGVTRAVYDRLFPYVTIYSGVPDVDALTAPEPVLRSIPGVNPSQVPAFLAERQQAALNPEGAPQLDGVGFVARRPLRAATITAEGRTATGATFIRQAVISITRDPATPYSFVAWRQGMGQAAPAQDASGS